MSVCLLDVEGVRDEITLTCEEPQDPSCDYDYGGCCDYPDEYGSCGGSRDYSPPPPPPKLLPPPPVYSPPPPVYSPPPPAYVPLPVDFPNPPPPADAPPPPGSLPAQVQLVILSLSGTTGNNLPAVLVSLKYVMASVAQVSPEWVDVAVSEKAPQQEGAVDVEADIHFDDPDPATIRTRVLAAQQDGTLQEKVKSDVQVADSTQQLQLKGVQVAPPVPPPDSGAPIGVIVGSVIGGLAVAGALQPFWW